MEFASAYELLNNDESYLTRLVAQTDSSEANYLREKAKMPIET